MTTTSTLHQCMTWYPSKRQALAILVIWFFTIGHAFLRIDHEIPDMPGADVFDVSCRHLPSSLCVNGWKSQVGSGSGSSAWCNWMSPGSSLKKWAARSLAICLVSKVSCPSWVWRAAIWDSLCPCHHLVMSHTFLFVTISSAHLCFADWVSCFSCFVALHLVSLFATLCIALTASVHMSSFVLPYWWESEWWGHFLVGIELVADLVLSDMVCFTSLPGRIRWAVFSSYTMRWYILRVLSIWKPQQYIWKCCDKGI